FAWDRHKQMTLLRQGDVSAQGFYQEIPFRYIKDHIFIDVEIEGQTYNFLFDTGFALSFIDDDLLPSVDYQSVVKSKVSGSSFEKHRVKFGSLSKITIAGIEFQNTGVGVEDLKYINDDYHCEDQVQGVIGANLLRKANWQIDYQQRLIRFTDDFAKLKVDPAAIILDMTAHQRGFGYGSVKLNFGGIEKNLIFDTGSSGGFTMGLEAWEEFQQLDPNFVSMQYGNEQKSAKLHPNYLIQIEELAIGELKLNKALLSLEQGASSLLGNDFLHHYRVSVNWSQNQLHLEPKEAIQATNPAHFPLLLRPDFEQNAILIRAKRSGTEYEKTKLGTQIRTINGEDVSSLSRAALCQFWQNKWPEFASQAAISIRLQDREAPILLQKSLLFAE
ncbi:MAG: retropepsin-like aspartic protease, partial [Bacteroidota bacterium]